MWFNRGEIVVRKGIGGRETRRFFELGIVGDKGNVRFLLKNVMGNVVLFGESCVFRKKK